MRIVIDTNILVSAVIRDRLPEQVILTIVDRPQQFQWIVSAEILAEYQQVLSRPKLKIVAAVQEQWTSILEEATTIVEVNVSVEFPRDQKDAKFLECAIAARASYCVTGDRDFAESSGVGNTKIISVSEFLQLVEENEA